MMIGEQGPELVTFQRGHTISRGPIMTDQPDLPDPEAQREYEPGEKPMDVTPPADVEDPDSWTPPDRADDAETGEPETSGGNRPERDDSAEDSDTE